MSPTHIVIIGMMGAGKTTTANELAARLHLRHRDSDSDIETLTGRTGRDIAETEGIELLHRLEEAMLLGALAEPDPLVVTAAGATIESPLCRDALRRRATVIMLDLSPQLLSERIATGSHRRSMPMHEIRALADARLPLMRESADLVVDAARPVEELVTEAVAFLEGRKRS